MSRHKHFDGYDIPNKQVHFFTVDVLRLVYDYTENFPQ